MPKVETTVNPSANKANLFGIFLKKTPTNIHHKITNPTFLFFFGFVYI